MIFQNHQTREILKEIKNQKRSIAVAVEGGGLRGMVSLAMLYVLKDLGLKDHIKALAGTSSGAINASYFLDDNLDYGLELYKRMASPYFIQPKKWPNAMNLDYLFKDQIPNHFPLSTNEIQKSNIDFFVTVTGVENGRSSALKVQELKPETNVLNVLRASASAPLFSTNKESIEGAIYNDGHVQMAIPYQPLLQYDVDYVLCLMTQKKDYKKQEKFLGMLHRKLALRKYSKSYKKSFADSTDLYNKQLQEIYSHPKLVPIQIEPEDFIVSKMSTDPSEMDQCLETVRKRITP